MDGSSEYEPLRRGGSAVPYDSTLFPPNGSSDREMLQNRKHAVRLAATYVKAAVFDRRIDHKIDEQSLGWVEFYYENTLFRFLLRCAVWGLLLITFFEDSPSTSSDPPSPSSPFPSSHAVSVPVSLPPSTSTFSSALFPSPQDIENVKSSDHIVWRDWIVLVAEAICWLVLMTGLLVRVRFTEWSRLWRSRFAKVHFVSLLVALVDLILTGCMMALGGDRPFRYARVVRPILQLEYNQVVRRRAVDILRTTYRVRAALLLLLFHITFFAVISMFLFYGSNEGKEYFSSMGDSMVNLIVLLSTCNSPKVMLPAFRDNKLYSLFFVCYLIVSVFFMLNLVLAVVYNEHRRHLKREAKRLAVRKRVCTSAAFRVLFLHTSQRAGNPSEMLQSRQAYEQGLPYDIVNQLLIQLKIPRRMAMAYSTFLDANTADAAGFVSRDDFEDVLVITYLTRRNNFAEDPADHEVHESGASGIEEEEDELEILSTVESISQMRRELDETRRNSPGVSNITDSTSLLNHERQEAQRRAQVVFDQASVATRDSFIAEPFRDRFDPDIDGEDACPSCISGCGKTKHTHAKGFKRVAIEAVMHHIWLGQNIGYVKTLDFCVNLLLVVSGTVTLVVISVDANAIMEDDPLEYAMFNTACSLFFAIEIILRIEAAGIRRFFQYAWNLFEFTIVLLSFLSVVTQFSKLSFFRENHHLFLFIRKLRLLRLLRSVPQFRLLTEILIYLIPALATFGMVIFAFMYMYAILGMGLLGSVQLPTEMDASSFASFPLALLTLFELMVVNDWNATMAAFRAATGSATSQLFFIVWYFFAVIVLLNSVTSFALEALDVHINHSQLLQNVQEYKSVNASPRLQQRQSIQEYNNRELKRGMSIVHRMSTVQKVNNLANSPMERNIFRLLHEVFDEEVDEPTTFEIDQELNRLGLSQFVTFAD